MIIRSGLTFTQVTSHRVTRFLRETAEINGSTPVAAV